MHYSEFKRHLGKAGLTIRAFANLIGKHPNSITNYAQREVPSHLAVMAMLMGEMADHNLDFKGPLSRIKIDPMKPRGILRKKASSVSSGGEI